MGLGGAIRQHGLFDWAITILGFHCRVGNPACTTSRDDESQTRQHASAVVVVACRIGDPQAPAREPQAPRVQARGAEVSRTWGPVGRWGPGESVGSRHRGQGCPGFSAPVEGRQRRCLGSCCGRNRSTHRAAGSLPCTPHLHTAHPMRHAPRVMRCLMRTAPDAAVQRGALPDLRSVV